MAASTTDSPAQRERDLLGQTVLVIGAQLRHRARDGPARPRRGADVILTARNPDRLHRVGLELGPASLPSTPPTSTGSRGSSTRCPRRSTTCWPRSLLRAAAGVRRRSGTPRRRRAPLAAAAGRSERREQGSPGRDRALHGRHRWPPHGSGPVVHLGAHAALSVSTVRLPTFSPVAISPASAQGVHETRDGSVDR
jgi:hypothetical protein